MSSWQPSRRTLLKASAASVAGAIVGAPALVRAQVKEVVIGSPAGAAKYFNADVFPVVEKALGIKVIYEGTNSLTNLQKMTADKDAPKMSVVIMDDPVMLVAAREGLITPITLAGSPNLGKLAAANVHQDGMRANYQMPWAGIAYNTNGGKAPTSWERPLCARSSGQSYHPLAEEYGRLLGAPLRRASPYGQALQGGSVRRRRGLQEARDAEAQPAQRLQPTPPRRLICSSRVKRR